MTPDNPTGTGTTIWNPFDAKTTYFAPSEASFMFNFRVDDLHALLAQFRSEGCEVDAKVEESEYGKSGWVMDPEGNRIELWQPPDGQQTATPRWPSASSGDGDDDSALRRRGRQRGIGSGRRDRYACVPGARQRQGFRGAVLSQKKESTMGVRLLRIAVVYLLVGALLGLVMGISQQFALAPVHAHLLLLGWASLALAGVIYHLYPAAAATLLARVHFWLHNLGLPVFMIALAMLLGGNEAAGPVLAIAASAVLVALVVFVANVLVNVKPAR